MSDKEIQQLIMDDLKYIKGKVDDLSAVTSNTAAKVDNHLDSHKQNPGRISIIIAIVALLMSISLSACESIKEMIRDKTHTNSVNINNS